MKKKNVARPVAFGQLAPSKIYFRGFADMLPLILTCLTIQG